MDKNGNAVKSWEFMRMDVCYNNKRVEEIIMTKEEVQVIMKRYPYVERAVAEGEDSVVFYVGKRRQYIEINHETKEVCRIVEDIYVREKDRDVLCMIDGIKKGRCDIAIIQDVNWEKNAYYDKKKKFIEKIYKCCIGLQLVDYDEILNEAIV